jgi:hypothetical protein
MGTRPIKKVPALRYKNLFKQIDKFQPTSILEVGVWMGDTAVKMIEAAATASAVLPQQITYVGFDLFEDITDEEIVKEHSKSKRATYENVYRKLLATKAKIFLQRGYTKYSIPKTQISLTGLIDFIFIDGGHFPETIASDWFNVQKFIHSKTIIIFDDYFKDKTDLGCKHLIDNLDRSKWEVTLLEPIDVFPQQGWDQYTQMVKVIPKF